ncbi:sugar phosphate isomerase/epimerase [Quadrisphaera sp. DSM 44207]|uniref:sugar phosphate isomerase/epimerase family protein n=1 Tax=Quadrisphaera sp. DSM 44207 TaxID=1881057 RepID=UPI0008870FFE|nr:sugar phosphate isomerase/epimerase [Quadrisphaera sp. DSM 44207]SDQ21188.1 Sugar phosphate isomerase/epimerase [Quadrisphaera sp. DSM 44207]
MKLGVYTAVLHDRDLPAALDVVKDLGLEGAEINAGGFLPPVHIPIDDVLTSQSARDDYLGLFADRGVALAGLNCNGNPLHPNPAIGPRHAEDLRRAIRAAGALGQTRVVTMSGLPGGEPGATVPNWVVNAWSSGALDVLDHQWNSVVVPFWREIDRLAADSGVQVAIEMHPQNVVFNPPTLQRLVERTGATHVGAEMDPSHLFWQGMDPVAAVEHLGDLVLHAAAKDVRINEEHARVYGVLDERFRRLRPDEDRVNLGGDEWVNEWPQDSAWDFVAVGRGHDAAFWARFLRALHAVDPNMAVNIEHEDVSLGRIEGLQVAASTLTTAREEAGLG